MIKANYKNPYSKQFQLEYAMYMMLTSYFKKSVCSSSLVENRLRLFYLDLANERQYKLEEKCIKCIEHFILPKLIAEFLPPEDVQNLICVVNLLPQKDHHLLHFSGNNFNFNLTVKLGNNHINFHIL